MVVDDLLAHGDNSSSTAPLMVTMPFSLMGVVVDFCDLGVVSSFAAAGVRVIDFCDLGDDSGVFISIVLENATDSLEPVGGVVVVVSSPSSVLGMRTGTTFGAEEEEVDER